MGVAATFFTQTVEHPLLQVLCMARSSDMYTQSCPLGLAGVGAATSGAGGVASAGSVSAATTALPGGSGQVGPGQSGKEVFEPLELNYLQLLGQEVCIYSVVQFGSQMVKRVIIEVCVYTSIRLHMCNVGSDMGTG